MTATMSPGGTSPAGCQLRICVFCGSSCGKLPEYSATARSVGKTLAERRAVVVYGGGRVGLMGDLAEAALTFGGEVIGVIPQWLVDKEVAHTELTKLCVVASMHERRRLMYDLSNAFLVLPGGLGTFEELFEVLSWSQLGLLEKPCGVLNVCGYFDFLPALIDRAIGQELIKDSFRTYPLFIYSHIEQLLTAMTSAMPKNGASITEAE